MRDEASEARGWQALLARHTDGIEPVFLLALQGRAPAVAARARPGLATVILASLAGEDSVAATDLDALFGDFESDPRVTAAIGLALLTSLTHVLGPVFDDAARSVWSEAYVSFVQHRMAARRNRMDLIA